MVLMAKKPADWRHGLPEIGHCLNAWSRAGVGTITMMVGLHAERRAVAGTIAQKMYK